MPMKCTQCGAQIQEGAAFCTSCGAKYTPAPPPPPPKQTPPPAAPAYQPPPQPRQPVQAAPQQTLEQAVKGTKYEPITTGGFVGIMLLLCIPVLGLILLIVWTCGGCRKISKRSFARASLLLAVIAIVIGIVVGLVFGSVFQSLIEDAGLDLTGLGLTGAPFEIQHEDPGFHPLYILPDTISG